MASNYEQLVKALRCCSKDKCGQCEYGQNRNRGLCVYSILADAAAAIEALQAEVKRLQNKLCDWCAVCPKERRKPEDCELLSETPVMYGPSDAVKVEAQE